jgi:murein L,D-transpeptidase YcbB/YkuD
LAKPLSRRGKAWLCGLASIPLSCAATAPASFPPTAYSAQEGWDRKSAIELLIYIHRIENHGLAPADYEPEALNRAVWSGDQSELDERADKSFGLVARDLANGHVRPAQRRRFSIAEDPLDSAELDRLIGQARTTSDVTSLLDGLAPRNAQYQSLRAALATLAAGSTVERSKIEASLERWRWMPRQMGATHVLVNIPEYQLHLLVDGREIATHRVIVGKPLTPTPQFSAEVSAVTFNPSWHVPQSIIAESVGRLVRNSPDVARARGYTWTRAGASLQVTQQPGAGNALGQMKLEMANPFTVYVHDTSSRELFDTARRALSHGCIRTDAPLDLASSLLASAGWSRAMIDDVVATRQTRQVALSEPVPIYTVYMTAYAAPDGTVSYFDDPYSLDQAINRLLDDRA